MTKVRFFILLLFFLPTLLFGVKLDKLRSGYFLGRNSVQFKSDYRRINVQNGFIHQFEQHIDYGIAAGIDFHVGVPMLDLGDIPDSFVIGDPSFELSFRLGEWPTADSSGVSTLFMWLGFKVGVSVQESDGKLNTLTGETLYYFPFSNGLSEFYFGAGYSFPFLFMTANINFMYYSETRGIEDTFGLDLQNDHILLGTAFEYYFEKELSIFGGKLNLGFKPFYEMIFHLAFSDQSGLPSHMDNRFGFWLRIGRYFRLTVGAAFPVALETRKVVESQFFFNLSVVFRD